MPEVRTSTPSLADRSREFLDWLGGWHDRLPDASLRADVLEPAGGPERVAVMVVDLLVGFCSAGPLSSPRVGALGPRTAPFLRAAWDAGIRRMVLATDSHPPDSPEFKAFPPHCITGTVEAEPIPELTELPFYDRMHRIRKTSINVGLDAELGRWQEANPEVTTWIVVGDCTDFCVYQAAMHLRVQANAAGRPGVTVWVPADLTDTFDLPVPVARELGALPHDAELIHRIFLYHMAVNGVRVARRLGP